MSNQPFNLPASVPDVHPAGVEQLVIAASRNEQLLLDFRRLLTPRHLFKPEEFAARVAYSCLLTAKDRYHGLSWEALCYAAAEYFTQHPDEADLSHGQAYQRIYGTAGLFVAMLTASPPTVTDNNFAREILRSLATERLVVEQLRRSVNPRSPMPDVAVMLATVEASYRDIATVNVLPQVSAFPEFGSEISQDAAVSPTGHHLIDSRVGGQRVGDANGIVGYTGGGKTSLSVDMAVSACKQSLYEHHTHGAALQPVVFITVEEPAANLRARMWSNYFDIPRAKLEPTIVWDRLSTADTMEDYEIRMQAGSQRVMSERDRYMTLREDAEKVMVVLDLSGSPPFEHCGRGGIDEIATYIDQVCQNFGVSPKSVFVDYAGLLVEREVGVKSKDASADAYFQLKRFADDFRMKVSAKFQTTSWLLQQLKGEAGKFSPTKILTLDDAAGCKSFADNMAMCLMMGIPDTNTGIRMLHFAKTRYKPTEAHIPPVLLKIHREFSRMEDMSTQYVTSASSRRFIERSQANQIGGFLD